MQRKLLQLLRPQHQQHRRQQLLQHIMLKREQSYQRDQQVLSQHQPLEGSPIVEVVIVGLKHLGLLLFPNHQVALD